MCGPVRAQCFQRHLGQEDEEVLLPLGLAHVQKATFTVDACHANAKGFIQTQAHAKAGENKDLVTPLAGTVDQSLQLFKSKHIGELLLLRRFDNIHPLSVTF